MKIKAKCVLISLNDDVSELDALARSLDFEVIKVFIQHKEKPNPKYYIGQGKVKEIRDFIEKNGIKTAIFDSSLRPSQQYNLESFLRVTVYDRIRLILEIFTDRAYSEEARLQVELAKLQYEIPLLRDWIHKARYGEKPGFMAGGEYEVDQYYEISRKRIKKIKQRLKKIEKERDIRRKQRRNLGYHLVSIVGYTNAGKSTLFNLIAGETVKVENRLFTTLSTTTRKIPKLKKPILITDTVGLIDNLPHWIIDAFHSTLEEIFLSDIILLIVDISESVNEINRRLKTGFDVLLPDINPSNIVILFNKIDKIVDNINIDEDSETQNIYNNKISEILNTIDLEHDVRDIILISANDNKYKDKIINLILNTTKYPKHLSIKLPNTSDSQAFISWLYNNTDISFIEHGEQIKIDLRCREKDEGYISKSCLKLDGKIL
jgi:GTP-binding protein HflX